MAWNNHDTSIGAKREGKQINLVAFVSWRAFFWRFEICKRRSFFEAKPVLYHMILAQDDLMRNIEL